MLRNAHGRDLENYVAHSQPNYVRPTGNLPTSVMASDNTYYASAPSGPSFFERLFGAQPAPPPPAPIGRRWQSPPRR